MPLGVTVDPGNMAFVLNQTEAAIFVVGQDIMDIAFSLLPKCPLIKYLIVMKRPLDQPREVCLQVCGQCEWYLVRKATDCEAEVLSLVKYAVVMSALTVQSYAKCNDVHWWILTLLSRNVFGLSLVEWMISVDDLIDQMFVMMLLHAGPCSCP